MDMEDLQTWFDNGSCDDFLISAHNAATKANDLWIRNGELSQADAFICSCSVMPEEYFSTRCFCKKMLLEERISRKTMVWSDVMMLGSSTPYRRGMDGYLCSVEDCMTETEGMGSVEDCMTETEGMGSVEDCMTETEGMRPVDYAVQNDYAVHIGKRKREECGEIGATAGAIVYTFGEIGTTSGLTASAIGEEWATSAPTASTTDSLCLVGEKRVLRARPVGPEKKRGTGADPRWYKKEDVNIDFTSATQFEKAWNMRQISLTFFAGLSTLAQFHVLTEYAEALIHSDLSMLQPKLYAGRLSFKALSDLTATSLVLGDATFFQDTSYRQERSRIGDFPAFKNTVYQKVYGAQNRKYRWGRCNNLINSKFIVLRIDGVKHRDLSIVMCVPAKGGRRH
jgi:hypothetical protein